MECSKKITKAIPDIGDTKKLSSQEFQGLLTSWYNEKGILSELRTQMRYKMINVLKNTAIGRDISRRTSQSSINLSKQAVNLIVAEFLMKNNCDYSLSLFNTEACLSNAYPEESNKAYLQFNKENILHILELIGIHSFSEMCDTILYAYFKNSDNTSLLSCLLQVLSKSVVEKEHRTSDLNYKSQIDLTGETEFIRQIGSILIDSNIPPTNILNIIQLIKVFHKEEMDNLENDYKKVIHKIKKAVLIKNKQLQSTSRKKKILEAKLLKLVGDYTALKVQMKNVIKDKLIKEKQIGDLKNTFKNNLNKTESYVDEDKKMVCVIKHCDDKCTENDLLVSQLKIETEELHKRNERQTEEICELHKNYADLLNDFGFLQNKVTLLNSKVTENMLPSSFDLPNETDVKYTNREHNYEKNQTSDSSDGSVDDVIKEARLKLQQLEKESTEIEEQYKSAFPVNDEG